MRKNMQKIILMISVALMFAIMLSGAGFAADGDVIYVATNGSDDNNGYSWDTAKLSIGNATGTVNANGTINIANGLYTGENNTNITIDKNMTIHGQSQTGTIINGTDANWIFYIEGAVTVTIQNLTFANGTRDEGGAIYNDGNLTLNNCTFIGNTAEFYGGAIYNEGTLTVNNCNFKNNHADAWGGAIENYGTLNVIKSDFIGNSADDGGFISIDGGSVNIEDSTFTGNIASNNGGAIWNGYTLTIKGSTFTGNIASNNGGAIDNWRNCTVTGSTFTNNNADSDGGAICNLGALTVNYCRIVGNSAGDEGYGNAIYNYSGEGSEDEGEGQSEQSVNAEYNWWGSNNPDFDSLIYGNVDYTPWLFMTLTANPTTINNTETSLITVNFNNYSSDGSSHTQFDPATGHIPDGSPVNFQTDLGTIGCKSIDKTTTGGIATAILTATELAGIAHINATTDNQTLFVNVTITPKSSLYLTVTPSKTNPVAGDTVMYTLKVGNKGPDTAEKVVMTYKVPEGLEFAGANVDMGKWEYDASTRTITWTIGDVPKGDPYIWLSLHIAQVGQYLINPTLSTSTNDPTLRTETGSLTVNAIATAKKTVTRRNNGTPVVNAQQVTEPTVTTQTETPSAGSAPIVPSGNQNSWLWVLLVLITGLIGIVYRRRKKEDEE